MGGSRLYSKAVAGLSPDERKGLAHVLDWMNHRVWTAPDYYPKIAWNVRYEHNLVNDEDRTDYGATYTEFLKRVAGLAAFDEDDRYAAYVSVCDDFMMHGREISRTVLSDPIYRYVMLGVIRFWGREAGMPAYWDTLLDTEPHRAFDLLVEQIDADKSLPGRLKLGAPKRPVWATFDDPDQPLPPEVRDNATLMARHLGLRPNNQRRSADLLFELVYERLHVSNSRYPTLADAGWEQRFGSADPDVPNKWGLTASGGFPRQPEVVHDNRPLTVLKEKPRFLGRVTPWSI